MAAKKKLGDSWKKRGAGGEVGWSPVEIGRGVQRGYWDEHDGLQVILVKAPGLTAKNVLQSAFAFQCAPLEALTVAGAFSHTDYDTVRRGQHSRPGGRQLRTLAFRTVFVDYDPTWASFHYEGPVPAKPWAELADVRDSGTPFKLIAAQPQLYDEPFSMLATLRELQVTENAGEPGTRYCELSFTEWRHLRVASGKAPRRPGPAAEPRKVRPKAGESLFELAKKHLGSGKHADMIRNANRIKDVPAHSEEKLREWMKKHNRTELTIPPRPSKPQSRQPSKGKRRGG